MKNSWSFMNLHEIWWIIGSFSHHISWTFMKIHELFQLGSYWPLFSRFTLVKTQPFHVTWYSHLSHCSLRHTPSRWVWWHRQCLESGSEKATQTRYLFLLKCWLVWLMWKMELTKTRSDSLRIAHLWSRPTHDRPRNSFPWDSIWWKGVGSKLGFVFMSDEA